MDAADAAEKGVGTDEDTHRLGDAEDRAGNTVRVVASRDVWNRFVEVNHEGTTNRSWHKDARCGELLHHTR